MRIRIFSLRDGVATAIVHSSLTDEEVIAMVNERAREYYPAGIDPDFKIDFVNELQEGHVSLLLSSKSDRSWWRENIRIKRYFANIAKRIQKIKLINPPFSDSTIEVSDITAIESYPDGTHTYIIVDPKGFERMPERGTFSSIDGELYFTVKE